MKSLEPLKFLVPSKGVSFDLSLSKYAKKGVLISGEAVLLYDSTCIVTTYRLELGSELNSRHVHA